MSKNIPFGYDKMKTEFFEYNGNKYPSGTRFLMKNPERYKDWQIVRAIFRERKDDNTVQIAYNTPMDDASSHIYRNDLLYRTGIFIEEKRLQDLIVEIIPGNHYIDMERNHKRYEKDTDDLNLVAKWGMYLFAMGITSIFNGRVLGWIMWTVIFFWWRHNYKEKECVYYE